MNTVMLHDDQDETCNKIIALSGFCHAQTLICHPLILQPSDMLQKLPNIMHCINELILQSWKWCSLVIYLCEPP